MRIKKLIYLVTLPILLLFSSTSFAKQNLVLQLRWMHQAQFIGYYVAKHKGFYSKAGLDVDIIAGSADIIPWQEVVQGNADFAVDNTNAFTAFSEGQPIQAIAAIFQHSPSVFLSRKDSNIHTVHDLKNKRIMLFPNDQDPELMALLRYQGLSAEDVELIPTSANLQDLIQGNTDVFNAYMTNEPYFMDQQDIPYNIINPRNYGIDFYSDILVTHQDTVNNKPELVAKFRQASIEGWHYALTHPEESLQLMHNAYPVLKTRDHSRYELNRVHEMILPTFVEMGHMNPERWKRIEQELKHLNIIKTSVDIGRFIYNPKQDFNIATWLPWIISGAVISLLSLISLIYLSKVNLRLKNEITRREQVTEQLRYAASHDALTGLPNRPALLEQLSDSCNNARLNKLTPALFYIDLDGFKEVNDNFGHACGDQLLQLYTARVNSIVHNSDIFGRLAGDEFLLICQDSTEESTSGQAMKIMETMDQAFDIDGHKIRISASIGIARYSDYNETPDNLLSRADHAMYQVKAQLKSGYTLAHPPVL